MDEAVENKLIQLAKQGSAEAFEKLILQYENNIYGVCIRILKDEQAAYDAAQDVCMKIWRQLDSFEGNSKFSTWIYRIATNQCLDIIRKNKRKEEVALYKYNKETGEEWESYEESPTNPVEDHMEQLALQDVIAIALDEVKEDYKAILVLRDMKGYSYDEISASLTLSVGTVKSRLSRARAALKKILTQDKEPYRSFFRQTSKREGKL